MNLLALLRDAARRVGLPQTGRSRELEIRHSSPDPDLEERIEHGLGRRMNRRELFRFTAIAAAVGTPVVRELILQPAKSIVVPPAAGIPVELTMGGMYEQFAGDLGIGSGPSLSETLAAEIAQRKRLLQRTFYTNGNIFERIMRDVEPHLGEIMRGRDPWADLGYDPDERYRWRSIRAALQLDPNTPDSERMVGGLYVPDGVEVPAAEVAADYDDEDDLWSDPDDELFRDGGLLDPDEDKDDEDKDDED